MAPLNKPVGNEKWNYYIASYFSCHLNCDGDGCKAAYVDLGNDPMLAEFDTWTPPLLAYLGDTSKCIDLPGGDTTNGNQLWLWCAHAPPGTPQRPTVPNALHRL